MKKIMGIVVASAILLNASLALAAPADGTGPWADTVISSAQGLTKSGAAVAADRSNPASALGVAESTGTPVDATATPGTFFSLGFGGTITLGFTNAIVNGPGNDLQIFEVTLGSYPDEKLKVEVSPNGSTWTVLAPSITRDGSVDLGQLACVQYVRLTDVSNPADFESTADGYDLDAVKALNSSTTSCTPNTWSGNVLSQGYWKNHPATVTSWNGMTSNPARGNACQNLANQAIGFLNNWNSNPSFGGVAFHDTYFNSNGLSPAYDGKTMQQIYTTVNSIQCSASSSDLLDLKTVLDSINNGQYIWF